MVCLGFEHNAAGWEVQMNPLSYGGIPNGRLLTGKNVFKCENGQAYRVVRSV